VHENFGYMIITKKKVLKTVLSFTQWKALSIPLSNEIKIAFFKIIIFNLK